MSCAAWRIIRRPEYREDLDAIEAWIAQDNASAAVAMWLLIDDQVEQLADLNFPRRPSTRVAGAHELVAHESYVVYFDRDESTCTFGCSACGAAGSVDIAGVGGG